MQSAHKTPCKHSRLEQLKTANRTQNKLHHHAIWLVITVVVWTLIISVSLFWHYQIANKQSIELASNVAQAYIYRDIALRRWGAAHGGVYVPVNEQVEPNPLLSHIPERDIVTPSGRILTLLNPVHILTQVMEEYRDFAIPKGKVTAQPETLLNPQKNMPDQWELSALYAFKSGAIEKKEVVKINGIPHFRLMIPLLVNAECLQCHTNQSYQVGDLSGALGVAVPMTPYLKAKQKSLTLIYISYGLFWAIGLFSLIYFFNQTKRHVHQQEQTQKKLLQLNQELEQLSFKDALTGIANRRLFDNALNREWKQAMRDHTPLSLIMIDVDFFKVYNDCYGHQQGDACLKTIAKILSEVAKRPKDMIARYGGEEFALLLPETELIDATHLAEECRKKIFASGINFSHSEIANVVTLSVGVCTTIPKKDDSPAQLLDTADKALYIAKKLGRNRVAYSHINH